LMSDVQEAVPVPILGELIHNEDEQHTLVVNKSSRTPLAELFRLIRTNLQFATLGKENKVILITSSMTREGKTFFSINMGASMALTGKRVVLLEFDIRKPKLIKDLGIPVPKKGITNYLVDKAITVGDLVNDTKLVDNLFVIGAGPIPPNPAELLL